MAGVKANRNECFIHGFVEEVDAANYLQPFLRILTLNCAVP